MTETELVEYLEETLEWSNEESGMIKNVRTFDSVGMMTMNEGLVVEMKDGSEFQLTIVKSK